MVRRLKFRSIGKDELPPIQFVSDIEYGDLSIDGKEQDMKPLDPIDGKEQDIKPLDPIDYKDCGIELDPTTK